MTGFEGLADALEKNNFDLDFVQGAALGGDATWELGTIYTIHYTHYTLYSLCHVGTIVRTLYTVLIHYTPYSYTIL
jgi:hypothetical protein